MNKDYLKGDAGWSCLTGQKAFEELLKIYIFLMSCPGCSDVFVINPVRNVNYRFCYICNGETMDLSCKAEGLSLDQFNYVYELSKKFKPTTRVKTLEEKTTDATELRLQVNKTLVSTMEKYQNFVAMKKKYQDQISMMKKDQNNNTMEDIQYQVVMTKTTQNKDLTIKDIQNFIEHCQGGTMEDIRNQDDTMEEVQNTVEQTIEEIQNFVEQNQNDVMEH